VQVTFVSHKVCGYGVWGQAFLKEGVCAGIVTSEIVQEQRGMLKGETMEMIHETWLHLGARKLFVVVTMN